MVEVTDKTDCGVRVANFTGHIERRDHIIAQPLSYIIITQRATEAKLIHGNKTSCKIYHVYGKKAD